MKNEPKTYENLYSFLKRTKIHFLIRRSIHRKDEYSCEIKDGWIKKNSFFLNVYGVGNSETNAINDLIKQISGRTIILNVDNDEKKTVIKVPFIYFIKEKDE